MPLCRLIDARVGGPSFAIARQEKEKRWCRCLCSTPSTVLVRVEDTRKPFGDVVVHIGTVESGTLIEGAQGALEIDVDARDSTRKNHSATHLLHHALHEVLGAHVRQRGSLVGAHRLRFDFSHTGAMTTEEMVQVDQLNAILAILAVHPPPLEWIVSRMSAA